MAACRPPADFYFFFLRDRAYEAWRVQTSPAIHSTSPRRGLVPDDPPRVPAPTRIGGLFTLTRAKTPTYLPIPRTRSEAKKDENSGYLPIAGPFWAKQDQPTYLSGREGPASVNRGIFFSITRL